MRLFDCFGRNLRREYAGIGNLYAVIVDCDTSGQIRFSLWLVIFPLRFKCLKKNAIPASSKSKKLPSARWLSINSFLSVPKNRAIRRRNCGYSSILFENNITRTLVGLPFFSRFHFANVSSIGALIALAGIRPPSTPRRMHPLICFSFKSASVTHRGSLLQPNKSHINSNY